MRDTIIHAPPLAGRPDIPFAGMAGMSAPVALQCVARGSFRKVALGYPARLWPIVRLPQPFAPTTSMIAARRRPQPPA